MITATDWKDYELLDAGVPAEALAKEGGMKLERWGEITLARPDPVALWARSLAESTWQTAHGEYRRSETGGGRWKFKKEVPERWQIGYKDVKFWIRPTNFKHTGLFPEQAPNWDWLRARTTSGAKILNLFAYTGAATVACAKAGADVTHVDAARGMVDWAKENCELNGCAARFLVDDAMKFVAREKRRGNRYDGILMDPPSFGRGAKGETWKVEKDLLPLVQSCADLLSSSPIFFLINSYTAGLSPTALRNLLLSSVQKKLGGSVEADELGMPIGSTGMNLPAGATGRWVPEKT